APKDGESEAVPAEAEAEPAQAQPEPAAAEAESGPAKAAPALLVDDTEGAGEGQMRKGEVMTALRESVCAAADEAMAATGSNTQGCPFVDYWFAYYEDKDAVHVERALRRYAPEAADAATASDYITFATARVRSSVETWAKTGEITGVPPEAAAGAAGG